MPKIERAIVKNPARDVEGLFQEDNLSLPGLYFQLKRDLS